MNTTEFWQAVCNRDATYNGTFFFAVKSTGIYCKPSCPARRPKVENVEFFMSIEAADAAGYRPCLRCHPKESIQPEPNLALMQQLCQWIDSREESVSLAQLAEQVHMSPFHLQRTFKRLIGVSPRQYAAAARATRLRQELSNGHNVTSAIYAAGYNNSSHMYDEANEQLGMTPTRYRRAGQDVTILYTIHPCALGYLLVAATERGLCAVRLGDSPEDLEATLRGEFAQAELQRNDEEVSEWLQPILDYLAGHQPHLNLPLDVRATAFQQQVWRALRQIPYGATRSYSDVARAIGKPQAVRAVARACATNSVALVVPCHRVVRENGELSGYRWGIERKRKLLEMEKVGVAQELAA